MKPITFLVLCVLTAVMLTGLFQIQLVQDSVTATGYSTSEVFSGIAMILIFFYTLIGIFTVRPG